MRIIKFRGKRKDNGKWVYGSIVYKRGRNFSYINAKAYIFWCKNNGFFKAEVIPETVGQFTGLIGICGTSIIDGDIVKISKGDCESEPTIFIIKWDKEIAGFGVNVINNGRYVADLENAELGGEVIGNIHDNPEFLKY
jgi:uncharacterized phage protein (TIGR01671 family)